MLQLIFKGWCVMLICIVLYDSLTPFDVKMRVKVENVFQKDSTISR